MGDAPAVAVPRLPNVDGNRSKIPPCSDRAPSSGFIDWPHHGVQNGATREPAHVIGRHPNGARRSPEAFMRVPTRQPAGSAPSGSPRSPEQHSVPDGTARMAGWSGIAFSALLVAGLVLVNRIPKLGDSDAV